MIGEVNVKRKNVPKFFCEKLTQLSSADGKKFFDTATQRWQKNKKVGIPTWHAQKVIRGPREKRIEKKRGET